MLGFLIVTTLAPLAAILAGDRLRYRQDSIVAETGRLVGTAGQGIGAFVRGGIVIAGGAVLGILLLWVALRLLVAIVTTLF